MVTPERIGRYEVDGVLGHGGFATVYSAVDPMLDARVAIKLLAENWCLDPDVRSRFVQEAQIMWRSDDDHIVRVHTVGETDDGRPYFVMQLADRGSLADRLAAAGGPGGLAPEAAVEIAARLAEAVDVVHRLGFVHRDLKPSNVLFRSRREHEQGTDDEVLMLADLGLAKALSDASGLSSSVGTLAYMAPEQADPSQGADERSDVYSLGVITYELLIGQVPSAGVDARASLDSIPGLAPSAVDAVTSALEARRDRRPQSAAAFRDALGPSARIPSVGQASGGSFPTARRRRRWALVGGALAVVLVAGIVWSATQSGSGHAALTTAGSHPTTGALASTTARAHASTTTRRGHTPTTRRGHPATTAAVSPGSTPLQSTPATNAIVPVVPVETAPPPVPVAQFSVSASTVRTGQSVILQSTSNAGVNSWKWYLVDGRTFSGEQVTVSWSSPGTAKITLTVSGPRGQDDISHVVTVNPPPPTVLVQQLTRAVVGVKTTWSVASANAIGGTWTLSGFPTVGLNDPSWLPGGHFYGTFHTVGATYVLTLTVRNALGETARSSVRFTIVAS